MKPSGPTFPAILVALALAATPGASEEAPLLGDHDISVVYGCVTTGTIWKFLRLEEGTAYVDHDDYYIDNVGKILGILVSTVRPRAGGPHSPTGSAGTARGLAGNRPC